MAKHGKLTILVIDASQVMCDIITQMIDQNGVC